MGIAAIAIYLMGGFHWVRTPGAGIQILLRGGWMYLGVAVYEELHYRGYAFQRLMEGTGPWIAVVLGGAYFAWVHWENPGMDGSTKVWASLNIGLAGILLGLAYLKTRSLAFPVGIHLGWNWTQGTLLGFGVSGTTDPGLLTPVFHSRPQWMTGGAFGLEASLPCAVVCAAGLLWMACWKERSESHESVE
jgi:membrane protease YdiL (CAAX protease family)